MTTVKEFETKKHDIIEIIEIAESYMYDIQEGMTASDISYEMGHVSVRLARARQEIKDLKILTRPTCATCKYFNTSKPVSICENDNVQFDLLQKKIVGLSCDFGCIHHSGLENYDEVQND